MDNNHSSNRPRPRKRVSKSTLRKRQLCALAVIALLVLLLIVLVAKACSKDSGKKGGDTTPTEPAVTTQLTTAAPQTTEAPTTTTKAIKSGPNEDSGFKLDKYSIYIDVGDSGIAYVQQYPEGSGEEDEVWTSSDSKIATVDNLGHVTGVSGGECYITLSTKKDPTKEVNIKVVVTGKSNLSNNNANSEPQQLAEAPAPPKLTISGVHYEGDTLIVNKSFSLPSDYNPGGLEATCSEWFEKLKQGAAKDGINIYLSSGFRSYGYQDQLYNSYCRDYGAATADTFSARPGHSEHQTGLAIDVNIVDDSFTGTPEAIWLAAHCYEYGFIIRYPQGKQDITGYKYEPWHIRYVGTEISQKIHEHGDDYTLEELYNIDSEYKS